MIARHELMSAAFHKWHLEPGAVLHRFTAPDEGEHHDHPFSLDIEVLTGGYVEEVLDPATCTTWLVERLPGAAFTIGPDHVHRIVQLLAPECWTVARYGEWVRDSGFWRVKDGRAERRQHDEGWAND